MGAIGSLLQDTFLPNMALVEQHFDDTHLEKDEIPSLIVSGLDANAVSQRIKPGMRIAITAGGRGLCEGERRCAFHRAGYGQPRRSDG